MSGETVRVTRDGDVARVRLSRPDVRNAFNADVIAELRAAFEVLATEQPEALRGVVLAGEGPAFCAGADVEWMRAAATFGFTETRLGIIPAVISTFVVPKIGESHARALFPTGQRFDADRAMRIGLVHEVVADETALDDRIAVLVGELRSAGPTAIRAAKSLVRAIRTLGPDGAAQHTPRHIAQQRASAEGQEGLAAFVDKRPPHWQA